RGGRDERRGMNARRLAFERVERHRRLSFAGEWWRRAILPTLDGQGKSASGMLRAFRPRFVDGPGLLTRARTDSTVGTGLFPRLRRAEHAVEMPDRPAPFADLAESLADIARLNAIFGGRRLTVRHVARLLTGAPRDRTITVLDVGTGAADLPRAVVRWARRAGRRMLILALDRDAGTVAFARRAARSYPEIVFLQSDALALPVRSTSIDVVISALTLHHLEPAAAARHLTEMDS